MEQDERSRYGAALDLPRVDPSPELIPAAAALERHACSSPGPAPATAPSLSAAPRSLPGPALPTPAGTLQCYRAAAQALLDRLSEPQLRELLLLIASPALEARAVAEVTRRMARIRDLQRSMRALRAQAAECAAALRAERVVLGDCAHRCRRLKARLEADLARIHEGRPFAVVGQELTAAIGWRGHFPEAVHDEGNSPELAPR